MGSQTINLDDRLYRYLLSVSLRETPAQQALRAETARQTYSMMQISPDQGQFMALLLKLIDARRVIEIGTYTGYSALTLALALPDDGRLIACDISREWTAIGARHWQQAGVAHKIDLRLAPAAQTLRALLEDGEAGTFDFAFIDADKENQIEYYQLCLQLIRPGGLIAIDNVLWGGSVADPRDRGMETVAIREFNDYVHKDARVDISLVPIGDGLTLARKSS
jgi:predicted O-methyltransferase YrrM